MTVELKTYKENGKIFLSVGIITYRIDLDYRYHAERADGAEDWFSNEQDALEFIGKGLNPPRNWTFGGTNGE